MMATFNGTAGNDVANATTGTLTGFSGGTVAELQDGTGDTFNGQAGTDTLVAGSGGDTINVDQGEFTGAESYDGGLGTDTLNFTGVTDGNALIITGGTVT